jgi:hypothetical protein
MSGIKQATLYPVEVKDVAWLAGLLEGEGCFTSAKGSHGHIN